MDVTKILEHDHREAEKLFGEIDKAEGADRQPLIDELNTALRAHMELEETVLYPMMEPVTGAEEVLEGNTEHALARDGLDAMLELAPDEPGFGARSKLSRPASVTTSRKKRATSFRSCARTARRCSTRWRPPS